MLGGFKMKKLSALFVIFFFLVSSVDAFVSYGGFPPAPFNVGGYVRFNDQGISNVVVSLTDLRTGYSETRTTNFAGAFLFELSNFKVNTPTQLPYQFGDSLKLEALGQVKTVTINTGGSMLVNFDLETALVKECSDGSLVLQSVECPVSAPVEVSVSSNEDKSQANWDAKLGEEFDITLTDNKLNSLKDSEIKFDGEDYDFSEIVNIKGVVKTSIDDVDYTEPYLTVDKKAAKYTYQFDESIPFNDVSEDTPLEIVFAGKSFKIVDVDIDSFTLQTGETKTLKLDECYKDVCLKQVAEDVVRVSVKGAESNIEENRLKTVNDVEIFVESIWTDDKEATLQIGSDVKREIKKGDEFVKDNKEAVFDFVIESDKLKSISIENKNEYSKTENSDYLAVKKGGSLKLFDSYLEVKFNGLTEYSTLDLSFEKDDDFLYVVGDYDDTFVINNEEFDELWIKDNGFYDGDFEFLTASPVKIKDSDLSLTLGNSISIGKLTLKIDLSDILYDGISFKDNDKSYLDHIGILFNNPEDGVKNKEFTVTIPNTEEDIEAEFTVLVGSLAMEIVPAEEEKVTTPTTPEEEKEKKQPEEKIVEKEVIVEKVIEKEVIVEKEKVSWQWIVIISAVGLLIVELVIRFIRKKDKK